MSNREIDDYLRKVDLTAFKSNDLWRRGDLKYIDTNGDGRVDGGKGTLSDHGESAGYWKYLLNILSVLI